MLAAQEFVSMQTLNFVYFQKNTKLKKKIRCALTSYLHAENLRLSKNRIFCIFWKKIPNVKKKIDKMAPQCKL